MPYGDRTNKSEMTNENRMDFHNCDADTFNHQELRMNIEEPETGVRKVTPVSGFMTTDGLFFPTENEALAHQHALNMTSEIEEFAKSEWDHFVALRIVRQWEEHRKFTELEKT